MATQRNNFDHYVTTLWQHLCQALPLARRIDGERAVHQARVATRRLGAAIDLARPWLSKESHKKIDQTLRQFRRGLGRLRDTDVMLARLEEYQSDHAAAVMWLQTELRERRAKARRKLLAERSKPAAILRQDFQLTSTSRSPRQEFNAVLGRAVRRSFNDFCKSADRLAGGDEKPCAEVDVHALRIAGKRARYTLEIAAEMGAALPKAVGKQFKEIQDLLGAWHDYVVLAQRAIKLASRQELALENIALFSDVLKFTGAVTADANAAIEEFKSKWREMRQEILPAVRQIYSTAPTGSAA